MTLFPIVERELRVAARKRSTYWTRFAAAGFCTAAGALVFGVMGRQSVSEVGMALFATMAGSAFALCLLSGFWLTADAISEEKREGTLGLLFLTDLRGFDVVLGKLVANSMNIAFCTLAIFPIMAFPLLLGGVTLVELGRVALALANALLFSLTAGLLASSVSHSARRAAILAFLIVGVLSAGCPALAGFWEGIRHAQNYQLKMLFLSKVLLVLSPGCAFVMAFEAPVKSAPDGPWYYWTSLGVVLAMSLLFVGLSCLIVPRSWQESGARASNKGWRGAWRRFWLGPPGWRKAHREQWLAINPFLWTLIRARWQPALPWLALLGCAVGWLVCWAFKGQYWLSTGTYIFTALSLGAFFKFWVASEAGRWLGDHRRSGTLELLLVTPLREEQIVRAHWRALRRVFLLPLLAIMAIDSLFMLLDYVEGLSYRASSGFYLWPAGLAVFALDFMAIPWVAMWLSLKTGKSHRALLSTVVRILVLPWVLHCVVLLAVECAAWLFHTGSRNWSDDELIILWTSLSLANSALHWVWAQRQLQSQFRTVATQPAGHATARA